MEINDKAIELLKKKIILLEGNNIKTKQLSDAQMIKKIKSMIEEEVRCYSSE